MNKYLSWISNNIKSREDAYRKCAEVTLKMQEEFPELIRVRGHYVDCLFGDRPHWWLKTVDGEIVDPTASQFNPGDYEEFNEDNPITGKCFNCGGYCYNHKCFCSSECNLECVRQLNKSV